MAMGGLLGGVLMLWGCTHASCLDHGMLGLSWQLWHASLS